MAASGAGCGRSRSRREMLHKGKHAHTHTHTSTIKERVAMRMHEHAVTVSPYLSLCMDGTATSPCVCMHMIARQILALHIHTRIRRQTRSGARIRYTGADMAGHQTRGARAPIAYEISIPRLPSCLPVYRRRRRHRLLLLLKPSCDAAVDAGAGVRPYGNTMCTRSSCRVNTRERAAESESAIVQVL